MISKHIKVTVDSLDDASGCWKDDTLASSVYSLFYRDRDGPVEAWSE